MRWPVKPDRPHRELRLRRRFAWLPLQVGQEYVWLEFFWHRQEWHSYWKSWIFSKLSMRKEDLT